MAPSEEWRREGDSRVAAPEFEPIAPAIASDGVV